jgi:Flp pilus assembly protein TadD
MRSLLPLQQRQGISSRVVAPSAQKKKGFGGGTASGNDSDGGKVRGGSNQQVKRVRQPKPDTGMAAREDMMVRRVEALEAAAQRQEEEEDFEARLAALRAAGKAKAAAIGSSASSSAAAASTASDSAFAPLPGPLDNINGTGSGGSATGGLYDKPPPPLAQTLLGAAAAGGDNASTISDPALRDAAIGPGRGLLAAGAIVLVAVLLFMAGAETAGPSRRYQGLRVAAGRPDGPAAAALERQAEELELRFAASSSSAPDLETLEALAVTRAQLFEFEKAEPLLARLTAAKPDDAEAWRLLGEVRLLAKDEAGAVAAYTAASKLRPDDLKIATGLADAYIANGQQGKAADYVIGLRKAGVPTKAGAEEVATAASGEGDGSAAPPYRRLDDVSARLLLGKAYAAWRGHDGDAFATYDDLIEAYPEDFRGYLAKGVLLKQRGRQADSERLLLQARFYAPDELKDYVSQRAGVAAKESAPEAPPDNNS